MEEKRLGVAKSQTGQRSFYGGRSKAERILFPTSGPIPSLPPGHPARSPDLRCCLGLRNSDNT